MLFFIPFLDCPGLKLRCTYTHPSHRLSLTPQTTSGFQFGLRGLREPSYATKESFQQQKSQTYPIFHNFRAATVACPALQSRLYMAEFLTLPTRLEKKGEMPTWTGRLVDVNTDTPLRLAFKRDARFTP